MLLCHDAPVMWPSGAVCTAYGGEKTRLVRRNDDDRSSVPTRNRKPTGCDPEFSPLCVESVDDGR